MSFPARSHLLFLPPEQCQKGAREKEQEKGRESGPKRDSKSGPKSGQSQRRATAKRRLCRLWLGISPLSSFLPSSACRSQSGHQTARAARQDPSGKLAWKRNKCLAARLRTGRPCGRLSNGCGAELPADSCTCFRAERRARQSTREHHQRAETIEHASLSGSRGSLISANLERK